MAVVMTELIFKGKLKVFKETPEDVQKKVWWCKCCGEYDKPHPHVYGYHLATPGESIAGSGPLHDALYAYRLTHEGAEFTVRIEVPEA